MMIETGPYWILHIPFFLSHWKFIKQCSREIKVKTLRIPGNILVILSYSQQLATLSNKASVNNAFSNLNLFSLSTFSLTETSQCINDMHSSLTTLSSASESSGYILEDLAPRTTYDLRSVQLSPSLIHLMLTLHCIVSSYIENSPALFNIFFTGLAARTL